MHTSNRLVWKLWRWQRWRQAIHELPLWHDSIVHEHQWPQWILMRCQQWHFAALSSWTYRRTMATLQIWKLRSVFRWINVRQTSNHLSKHKTQQHHSRLARHRAEKQLCNVSDYDVIKYKETCESSQKSLLMDVRKEKRTKMIDQLGTFDFKCESVLVHLHKICLWYSTCHNASYRHSVAYLLVW